MSSETAKSESGWSVDTLKDHLTAVMAEVEKRLTASDGAAELRNEQRFTAQQQAIKDALISQKEAVAAALVAAEKAVLVAENNAEKWRANANEWRASMLDREAKFASRLEMDAKFDGLTVAIQTLKESRAEGTGERSGKLSQQQFLFALLAAAVMIFGVVMALKR